MPAARPRASFEPIAPDIDLKALVEATPNFSYVDRISCEMIDQQGMAAFEKLILVHVVIGGKPLVIDGFEERLDPWTFTPKWLRDNCGSKEENAWDLRSKQQLPLTIAHYLSNMSMLTNQFFSKPGVYRDSKRQRVYLKDIDCPDVWQDKLRDHIPSLLFYLNESTGEAGGPGAVPDGNIPGRRLGKGAARAGDLMSSLPPDMRAENLMCYIGHEGTFTPAHREMCASLGQNIMVEASKTVSDEGKPEKPGSSIWFMTESKDRHTVSEYWLSVLGHDIEVENHFAQIVAWKKAPFNVYVVEQRPGDFILIPPLAPHQVWNQGTRTMKVAWNRTTVETLEMALNEALPRSRIVCRDEQYKNKAIVYYTLQKYSSLLNIAQNQAAGLPPEAVHQLLFTGKIKQLGKDFRRLFKLYKEILLSEMLPDERESKSMEYVPFDSNVTCAYCRGNIFNRFLTCPTCKDLLGHSADETEGDPYDVCLDCYAMGRSCGCISGLKWVEQFRWKELAVKYESWRRLIISLDRGQVTEKTPLPISEERKRYGRKTLAEVCKEQLKRRPWKDVHRSKAEPKSDAEEEEEIVVDDSGMVKKIQKKRSKAWLKNNSPCHVCCHRHPNWKMARCTTCERWWCYGTLFRGWDKMPIDIMSDSDWSCPHCLGICFAGACKRDGKMQAYEPKGTLLGHDTRKVADVRSVEALVDFSVSNLNWLRDDDPADRAESRRLKTAGAEAQRAKDVDPTLEVDEDEEGDAEESRIELERSPTPTIDPALAQSSLMTGSPNGEDDENELARRLQQANSSLPPPAAMVAGAQASAAPNGKSESSGYTAVNYAGYIPPAANMYPQPGENSSYAYPGYARPTSVEPVDRDDMEVVSPPLRPFKRRREDDDAEEENISMTKHPRMKKPRLTAAGFRSTDLAAEAAAGPVSKAKNEAQRQFEREKERKALDKAKNEGRFIMLQAALKGKRRLVKLPISGARLAQLVAQQASRVAPAAAQDSHEDGEEDQAAAQSEEDEDEEDGVLLKSDIVPKVKQDSRRYYEQRQREGHVLNSTTKKALIPVEKDDSYGQRDKGVKAKTANPANKKTKEKRSYASVEFEEVDIGSEEDTDDESYSNTNRAGSSAVRGRRSLPGYMQRRHGDDDEEFPDQLPDDYRDGAMSSKPKAGPRSQASSRPAAGKRPNMRPSFQIRSGADADDETPNEDDTNVDETTAQPSKTFVAVNTPSTSTTVNLTQPNQHSGSSQQPKGRPVGRPRKNVAFPSALQGPNTLRKATHKNQTGNDEQNRMAKLQALEMLDKQTAGRSLPKAAQGDGLTKANRVTISMADALDDEEGDESDDGIEEVPA